MSTIDRIRTAHAMPRRVALRMDLGTILRQHLAEEDPAERPVTRARLWRVAAVQEVCVCRQAPDACPLHQD